MGRKIGSHNKHKKEKPTKEKKKRGRPTKQSQHQKQNQVVNVTINSDGGGNEKKKKKNNFQEAVQSIPNMIFNPSLSIPQGFPITRPETNPPLYDMNSLIQSIQKATSQSNPRIPQPIRPVDVQPIDPVNVQPIKPNPTPNQPTTEKPTPPIIVDNPSKPDYTFTNDDIQHLVDDIHNKHKK